MEEEDRQKLWQEIQDSEEIAEHLEGKSLHNILECTLDPLETLDCNAVIFSRICPTELAEMGKRCKASCLGASMRAGAREGDSQKRICEKQPSDARRFRPAWRLFWLAGRNQARDSAGT